MTATNTNMGITIEIKTAEFEKACAQASIEPRHTRLQRR